MTTRKGVRRVVNSNCCYAVTRKQGKERIEKRRNWLITAHSILDYYICDLLTIHGAIRHCSTACSSHLSSCKKAFDSFSHVSSTIVIHPATLILGTKAHIHQFPETTCEYANWAATAFKPAALQVTVWWVICSNIVLRPVTPQRCRSLQGNAHDAGTKRQHCSLSLTKPCNLVPEIDYDLVIWSHAIESIARIPQNAQSDWPKLSCF